MSGVVWAHFPSPAMVGCSYGAMFMQVGTRGDISTIKKEKEKKHTWGLETCLEPLLPCRCSSQALLPSHRRRRRWWWWRHGDLGGCRAFGGGGGVWAWF